MRFFERMRSGVCGKYFLLSLVVLLVGAVVLTWFLEYRYFLNNAGAAWDFLWGRSAVFWFSVLLMFIFLAFLTGLVRRPVIAVGVTWAGIIILTYMHICKFEVRHFPLLPEDFALASEAASLAKFVDVGGLVRTILAVVLVFGLTFLANFWVNRKFFAKSRGEGKKWWRKWAICSRVLLVVFSAVLLLNLTDFVRNHQGQKNEEIVWLGTSLVAWDQVQNYNENGFILGFLYNLNKFELTEPNGYSEERMDMIAREYKMLAANENAARVGLDEEGVNVVTILDESFIDPEVSYGGYDFTDYYPYGGGEIVPTLRMLQAEYPSGYMYSTDYGGGTANVEYEVATGLTNYWANTVPYTNLIPKVGSVPSVASYLKSLGYGTTVIHPFNGSLYKRNISLKRLGYDNFVTETEMDYTEREGKSQYINDRSVYLQALDVLGGSERNQLVTIITMQNHMPYDPDIYEETDFAVLNDDLPEGRWREIEVYYQSLYNSDRYLGEFLTALQKFRKKTVVLFFGDHSPGIFDLTNGSGIKEVHSLSRLTPYAVYANYDAGLGRRQLPMTTPNCLGNTLFNVLGVRKPELFYLLDTVCDEDPVLSHAWLGGGSPFMSTVLSAYELVNYDLLGGKQYWAK